MMEYWNIGVVRIKSGKIRFFSSVQPIIPVFHYSNILAGARQRRATFSEISRFWNFLIYCRKALSLLPRFLEMIISFFPRPIFLAIVQGKPQAMASVDNFANGGDLQATLVEEAQDLFSLFSRSGEQ